MNQTKESLEEDKQNDRKEYRCFCGKCYSSYAGLYLHLKSKHQDAFSKYKNMKISKLLIPIQNEGQKQAYRLKQPPKQEIQAKNKSSSNIENEPTKQSKQEQTLKPKNSGIQYFSIPAQNSHFHFSNFYQNGGYPSYMIPQHQFYPNQINQQRLLNIGAKQNQRQTLENYQNMFHFPIVQQQNMPVFPAQNPIQSFYSLNDLQTYPLMQMYQPLSFPTGNEEKRALEQFQGYEKSKKYQEKQKKGNQQTTHSKDSKQFKQTKSSKQSQGKKDDQSISYSNEQNIKRMFQSMKSQQTSTLQSNWHLN